MGFEIERQNVQADNRFVGVSFAMPVFIRHGVWRVVVSAVEAANGPSAQVLGEVAFRVQEYGR